MQSEKNKEPQMTPFSNGSEAMNWLHNNCSRCVKSCKTVNDIKFSTLKHYVSIGKECKLKFHIDMGFITGEIPVSIAQQIGLSKTHGGLSSQCMFYNDDEDDGYKPPERPKPDRTPPNQLLMPFYLQEIGIKELDHQLELV